MTMFTYTSAYDLDLIKYISYSLAFENVAVIPQRSVTVIYLCTREKVQLFLFASVIVLLCPPVTSEEI